MRIDPRGTFRNPWLIAGLVAVPLIAVATILSFKQSRRPVPQPQPRIPGPRESTVKTGGIDRPASDLTGSWGDQAKVNQQYQIDSSARMTYGAVPLVDPAKNPAVAGVYEAAQSGREPQKLSPMSMSEPFDRAAYLANPTFYLEQHVPGRVWQSAIPGPGVPALQRQTPRRQVLRRGEAVRLAVATEPQMPATFTSFDIGTFDNGLASITVAANDGGVASAVFYASPGKVGEVNVVAASPAATERIKFDITILTQSANESNSKAAK